MCRYVPVSDEVVFYKMLFRFAVTQASQSLQHAVMCRVIFCDGILCNFN